MSTMSNVNNVKCHQCQLSTMSNVNKIKCQRLKMSTLSNLPKSVKICPDLLRSIKICQNPTRSIKILWDLSDNVKMSTKLSNCQNINKLSNCHNIKCQCYQSVWIRLAHRLYIDFQYFFICHGGNDQEDGSDDDKIFLVSLNRSS